MLKINIIILPLLLKIIGSSGTNLVTPLTDKNTSSTFVYDDDALRSLDHQVGILKETIDNTRLSIELNTLRLEMALLKTSIIDELKELRGGAKMSQLATNFTQKFAAFKTEILEGVNNEIAFLNNSLSSSLKNEIGYLKVEKSEISDLRETIITNISQSIQTTMDGKLDKLENSLFETKGSLANLIEKVESLHLPNSCVEALQNGGKSGIYKLRLTSSVQEPFNVYCLKDTNNGPAWTVVQRRQDGSTDFYRNWEEYKNGFGDLNAEFFIGLDHLHDLTNQAKLQELWIKLTDWTEATKYAKYSAFQIGDETSKYNIAKLGTYSGDAGDSLVYHNGMKFSTHDSDNDGSTGSNCAETHKSAWWFNNCTRSHLNGEYLHGELPQKSDNYEKGINWYGWRGDYYSLKYAQVAIRPIN